MQLTETEIQSISQDLDMGMNVYIHKTTKTIIVLPNFDNHYDDTGLWDADIKKVKKDIKNYYKLEKPRSNHGFQIMADFAESLPESAAIKSRLFKILHKSKPFANFKNEIDNSEWREKWFEFKDNVMVNWVKNEIENFE